LSDQSLHRFRGLTVSSVQTTTGGQCMSVLLTAIWPSFANIPNHIPADQGITTSGMCGFVLYFLLQLPFLCIPYTKV
jgi:NCS1 family nucleobase:cation symporter-1